MINKANLKVPAIAFSPRDKIGSSAIALAWLGANFPALQWLFESFQDTSAFNLIIFSVVTIALLIQAIRHRRQLELSLPILQPVPLILLFGSAISANLGQWLLDVPQISVLLFAIGTYGLLGLFISPRIWRKGLPAAILAACILPFSVQFGTGLGFPVRVITARAVEHILAVWQIAAISSHDIIVLENSIARVDLPCSGLKSLWTGTLFLLAATWLENRQIRFKWLLVCLVNILLLIAANIGRVLLLVLVSNVYNRPDLGQIVHIPLGLIGFISASLVTWLLLQTVPRYKLQPVAKVKPIVRYPTPLSKQFIVCAWILGIAFIPHPPEVSTSAIASIQIPPQMHSTPLQLTEVEQEFFANYQGAIAQKHRFEWKNISGSMLLVSSNWVQAYHAPELCLLGNGLKIDAMQSKQLAPKVLARWLSLNNGTLAAAYWFQSPQHTTDDFLKRLWGQITRKDRLWVMVSVLFDQAEKPDAPAIESFSTNIHDAIASALKGV